jgi:hypothetical protein
VRPATFYLPTTRGVRGCVVAMCSPRKSRESNATSRMMRLGVHLLLVDVMLCCLAISLASLPATTAPDMAELPSALAGADEDGGGINAPLPDGSYSWTPAEEVQKTDKHPFDAFLLTMLVLVTVASFGASVLSPLAMNARKRWGAMCPWDVEVHPWLAASREKPSFLGVFRL